MARDQQKQDQGDQAETTSTPPPPESSEEPGKKPLIDAAHDFLIMGSRKSDSDMKPLLSRPSEIEAFSAAAALRVFNYRVEVWQRITEKK
jgi:hypothetical protein